MTFQHLLSADLDTARAATRALNPFIDPRAQLRRLVWAVGEVRAKVVLTPAIEHALVKVLDAVATTAGRLGSAGVLLDGVEAERRGLSTALDGLQAALRDAQPNETIRFVFNL